MRKIKVIYFSSLLLCVVFVVGFLCSKQMYAIKENNNSLLYNNVVYNEVPYDFEFGKNRHLLPNDRIDISDVLINDKYSYVLPKTYYVYKGDTFDSPNVIYKQNHGFGTAGWLYIKEGFDYTSANIETHKIVEVFVEHVDVWSTEDSAVIERVKMAILNKENLVPIVSEYTDIEWYRLYVRYENSPFVQEIGTQKSGEFQYNNLETGQSGDGSSVLDKSNN